MTGQSSTRTAQEEEKCPYYNKYFFHVGITANTGYFTTLGHNGRR